MNFTELCNAVYTLTNRDDLIAETKLAVLSATLTIHAVDLFPRDAIKAQILFDTPAYYQVIDITELPRFRRLFYIRKEAPESFATTGQLPPLYNQAYYGNNPRNFLRILDPNDILDDYGVEKSDVCYLAGDSIHIKSSTALQYILLSWYAYPNAEEDNYISWIAQVRPYAIVYKAASQVFNTIGFNEVARTYDRPADPGRKDDQGGLVQQEIIQLIADNLLLGDN